MVKGRFRKTLQPSSFVYRALCVLLVAEVAALPSPPQRSWGVASGEPVSRVDAAKAHSASAGASAGPVSRGPGLVYVENDVENLGDSRGAADSAADTMAKPAVKPRSQPTNDTAKPRTIDSIDPAEEITLNMLEGLLNVSLDNGTQGPVQPPAQESAVAKAEADAVDAVDGSHYVQALPEQLVQPPVSLGGSARRHHHRTPHGGEPGARGDTPKAPSGGAAGLDVGDGPGLVFVENDVANLGEQAPAPADAVDVMGPEAVPQPANDLTKPRNVGSVDLPTDITLSVMDALKNVSLDNNSLSFVASTLQEGTGVARALAGDGAHYVPALPEQLVRPTLALAGGARRHHHHTPHGFMQYFLYHHGISMCLVFGFAIVALLGALGLGAGLVASSFGHWRLGSDVRHQVESLQRCTAAEIEQRLPTGGGYDLAFSKPLSSCQLLRLEGRVRGPIAGRGPLTAAPPALTAPLTGQPCVIYSASVSRQVHDGMHAAPVAFSSASTDFSVALLDAPHIHIELSGESVSLFDLCGGRLVERCSLANCPERWQDFTLVHRTTPGNDWTTSFISRTETSILEFQECALFVGAVVTLVGELHRGADGTLTLRPLQSNSKAAVSSQTPGTPRLRSILTEKLRASWDRGGATQWDQAPGGRTSQKVLISDDPTLLDTGTQMPGKPRAVMCKCRQRLAPGTRAPTPDK